MSRRRAFTLAELVVVLTAGSVLLTIAIGAVHRAMFIQRQDEGRDHVQRTVARLARDFRRDVRQAATAKLSENRLTLTHASPSEAEPITYLIDGRRLVRRQSRGENAMRREVYELDAKAKFSLANVPETSQVRLVVVQRTPLRDKPTRLLAIIEATPGSGGLMP